MGKDLSAVGDGARAGAVTVVVVKDSCAVGGDAHAGALEVDMALVVTAPVAVAVLAKDQSAGGHGARGDVVSVDSVLLVAVAVGRRQPCWGWGWGWCWCWCWWWSRRCFAGGLGAPAAAAPGAAGAGLGGGEVGLDGVGGAWAWRCWWWMWRGRWVAVVPVPVLASVDPVPAVVLALQARPSGKRRAGERGRQRIQSLRGDNVAPCLWSSWCALGIWGGPLRGEWDGSGPRGGGQARRSWSCQEWSLGLWVERGREGGSAVRGAAPRGAWVVGRRQRGG